MRDLGRHCYWHLRCKWLQVERVCSAKEVMAIPAATEANSPGDAPIAETTTPEPKPAAAEPVGGVGCSKTPRASQVREEDELVSRTKYLVKWEGLPYCECTWEFEEDVLLAGEGANLELWMITAPE